MFVITSAEVRFAPAHQTAIRAVADPAHRGRSYGVVGLAQLPGVAVAPLVGGVLLEAFRHHHVVMWSTIAAIGIAQAWCFVRFTRRVPSPS